MKTWTVRRISTLDPLKLTPDDWVDLRGFQSPVLQSGQANQGMVMEHLLYEGATRVSHFPWPATSCGFFDFHRPRIPTAHPAAGSLRFRWMESAADLHRALDFSAGSDTSAPTAWGFDLPSDLGGYNVPWSIPLLKLRQVTYYSRVWSQLEDDGLVTPKTSDGITTLLQGFQGTRVLEDIADPWIPNLDLNLSKSVVLAKDRIYHVRLRCPTMTENARKQVNDKQGVALVRFELDDKEQLIVRVLKYLVRPGPDITAAKLSQNEGQPLCHYMRTSGSKLTWLPPKPWSADPQRYLSPASIAVLADKYR
ncbi:hypothetical protein BKA70DRAFT_1570950 [Coprinopsis sp. MPI-PUGE-AT-0042]|nr:hypothetical protein BKA70DRAFT_1570950 [Coprinopsis sp. MPI-PUGE-AT-0042]